jgi:hypothetical protein
MPHAMACRPKQGAANGEASLQTVSDSGTSALAMRNMTNRES